MAKRFTDKEKWKNPWYRKLPSKMKIAMEYLLDSCDHAGIWHVDLELMSFQTGETYKNDEIDEHLSKHIIKYKNDKWFIVSYIDFQYGELSEESRVHKSVINILKKERVWIEYTKSIRTLKDKDIDKNKDKDKDILPKLEFDKIYEIYPRKVGKTKGLEQCKKQIKTEADFQALEKSVLRYKAHCASEATDPKFIKHFATFMNCWRDWTEPDTGKTDLRVVESHGWFDKEGNPIDFNREREEW